MVQLFKMISCSMDATTDNALVTVVQGYTSPDLSFSYNLATSLVCLVVSIYVHIHTHRESIV